MKEGLLQGSTGIHTLTLQLTMVPGHTSFPERLDPWAAPGDTTLMLYAASKRETEEDSSWYERTDSKNT